MKISAYTVRHRIFGVYVVAHDGGWFVLVCRSAGGGSDIDVKSLPGLEALDTPGV